MAVVRAAVECWCVRKQKRRGKIHDADVAFSAVSPSNMLLAYCVWLASVATSLVPFLCTTPVQGQPLIGALDECAAFLAELGAFRWTPERAVGRSFVRSLMRAGTDEVIEFRLLQKRENRPECE